MKKLLLFLSINTAVGAKGQRIVYHADLVPQTITNSTFKIGMNEMYANKLGDIGNDRAKISAYTTTIEELQRKVFNSLTNVDGAIKNGKTLYYISQKIPQIFKNLETASTLAAGKPCLVTIATEHASIIVQRVIKLQTHLQDFVLKDDSKTLINPTDRDKFVYEVYQNINIIYSLSTAMVSRFKLYNLQDAVNKVVPYQMYINVDKIIIQDIAKKLKF